MKVGILALQGDFREHGRALRSINVDVRFVRRPSELDSVDGLVIPGGESTTIAKLLTKWELFSPLQRLAKDGFPVFGTCAGLILLAANAEGVKTLKLMDIGVKRNAYGRQIESFEAELSIQNRNDWFAGETITGVFIRAPQVDYVGRNVQIIATHESLPVLMRQENLLGATFHPELTSNVGVHRYFVEEVIKG